MSKLITRRYLGAFVKILFFVVLAQSSAAVADADVSISLNRVGSAEVAGSGVFEAIVTNLGPDIATNVRVTITSPPQINVTGRSTPGAPFKAPEACSFGPPFTCMFGNLAVGEAGKLPYSVTYVSSGTAVTTAAATTDSTDANSGNNTASVTTEIAVPQVDLALSVLGPATAAIGEVFGYSFLATNNGPGNAQSVTVDYTLPPEVALDGIIIFPLPVATSFSCIDSTATRVICRFEPLRAGQSAGVVARVKVISGTSITNFANVSGEGLTDPDASNNMVTLITTIVPTANLALEATSPNNPIVGEQFDYVFTVTNSGPEMATNVIFNSESLPPEVSFVSATPASCAGIDPISCNLATLASGSSTSVNIKVDANAVGLASASGTVSSDLADGNEIDDSAFSTSVITAERLPPGADVSVSITGLATAEVGQIIAAGSGDEYAVIVTNLGPDAATNVGVTITLPPQVSVTFRSTPGSPFKAPEACSFGPPFTCTFGNLAAGEAGKVPYGVRFDTTGTAVTTAAATADSTDSNSGNNSASLTTEVTLPEVDLEMTITGPTSAVIGDTVTYTFRARNLGPSNAPGVTIDFAIPPEFVRVGSPFFSNPIGSNRSCAELSDTRVTCTAEPIRDGQSFSIGMSFTADSGTSAMTTATATGVQLNDPVASNNSATLNLTIVPPNLPPAADNQSVTAEGVMATPITLSGSDPDGDAFTFTVAAGPANGALTGVAPNLTYTSVPGFLGADSFTFVTNDGEFDSDPATVSITVLDTTPPDLTLPADDMVEATAVNTPVDIGMATATDLVDGVVTPTNDAPDSFPLDTTPVIWTATDSSGNVATGTQQITVVDTTPPDLTVPAAFSAECNEAGGVSINDPAIQAFLNGASATDIVDSAPVITNDAPALFLAGSTNVTFAATDFSGNSASAIVTVTVVDTTPPDLSLSVSPTELWPPNHNMIPINVAVSVSDICDTDPPVELTLVQSSEGDEIDAFDPAFDVTEIEGRKGNDIQLIDGQLFLRAERSGNSNGRVYTITYQATDASGNSTTATATVEVPHNQ